MLQGWAWVDEGRDGRHKYGYVTEEADHDITFVVREPVQLLHGLATSWIRIYAASGPVNVQ